MEYREPILKTSISCMLKDNVLVEKRKTSHLQDSQFIIMIKDPDLYWRKGGSTELALHCEI